VVEGPAVKYVYFVSFSYVGGFGSVEMTSAERYTTFVHVKEAQEIIARETGLRDPVVLNYQLLRTEDA
jgi:hypothetical protein